MEKYSYKPFFQKLFQSQQQKFAFQAKDTEQADIWRQEFRQGLRQTLGLEMLSELSKQADLQEAKLVEQTAEQGYCRYKYVLETLPQVYMPFYMLVPDGIDKEHTAKAMIVIPAHGANKNTVCGVGVTPEEIEKIKSNPKECYGLEFVQKGYIVFCPDMPGYGERLEPIAAEDKVFCPEMKQNSLQSSCKNLALTAEAMGLSLTALELWDLLCLLDFACDCPEITKGEDGCRIGCAGFSGGGQYAMWLAAMDDRIKLCVISGYVHSYYESMLECHLCSCNYAPGLWGLGEVSDICAMIAPRPLFVENGTQDVENGPLGIEGPKNQVAKIRTAYSLYNSSEKLVHETPEGVHRWYGRCYDFVQREL